MAAEERLREEDPMNKQTQADFRTASPFKTRYDNFIGGTFVPPVGGRYIDNITPITGLKICEVARSGAEDIEKALDAAHAAKEAWGKTSPAHRSNILLKIADRLEANLETCWPPPKPGTTASPIRETVNADIPLVDRPLPLLRGRACACPGRHPERDRPRLPSPITSTSRWASSARSSRGTSRS
jgi:hypothetical protein